MNNYSVIHSGACRRPVIVPAYDASVPQVCGHKPAAQVVKK